MVPNCHPHGLLFISVYLAIGLISCYFQAATPAWAHDARKSEPERQRRPSNRSTSNSAEKSAKDDWPVPRGPSREPVPYSYDPAVWKQVPGRFLEDAPACILYSGSTNIIEADGTVETISHDITRLNGRKGIEKLGEYHNISYDPAYQQLILHVARVHKPSGRVVEIGPQHVQLRDSGTDYQVYSTDKQLIISFPKLEIGDVIEVKWTVRGKNPEYGGHYFSRYSFGDDVYPVVRDDLVVRLPRSRNLKYASVAGTLEPIIREEGDWRTYHWCATNRDRLPQDENLPSKEEFRLQVAYSTFESWDEVGRWKLKLRSDCWACNDAIRKVVAEVTRGQKTPLEKARALTYWVRRNVRYVSVGVKHAYTPHPPARVFDTRFGDCKDTSQLLAVMMREAGLKTSLATLGALDDGQVLEAVPSPWGTHAILLVTIDGKDHWIDTTTSLAAWDFLPRDDRDRLCYVIDTPPLDSGDDDVSKLKSPHSPNGNIRLVRTPPLTPEENRIEQVTCISVGSDGASRCKRTVSYEGIAAVSQRDSWTEVPAGERRRLATAELQDAHSRTRLSSMYVNDQELADFERPVRAELVFEIPGHFTLGAENNRDGSIADSKVWGKLLAYNLDDARKAPLELGSPFELLHRYVVTLPPAYRLESVPKDKTITSKWGSFRQLVKVRPAEQDSGPRKVEITFRTRLDDARVLPADFEEFRKFHESVSKSYRVWLTLKPTSELADAPALEAVLALTPDDHHSALILGRLYQQHDKRGDARRVLQKARHHRPKEQPLWELAVQMAENPEQEEELYREMVKRFPRELRYAVSLGSTLIRLGKYQEADDLLGPVVEKGTAAQRAQAFYYLAQSRFHQDKAEKALEYLEAAARADQESVGSVSALQFRARVHEKLGQMSQAAEVYRQSLKADANAVESLAALVRLAVATDDRQAALKYLRRYAVVVADDAEGLTRVAEFYLKLGRLEDAQEFAGQALELGAGEEAQKILGMAAHRRGQHKQAVTHLSQIKAAQFDVIADLVRSHIALGNLTEAEKQLERIKTDEPPQGLAEVQALVKLLSQRQKDLSAGAPVDQAKAWGIAAGRLACAEHLHKNGTDRAQVESLLHGCFADDVEIGPAYSLRGLLYLEQGRLARALTDAEHALSVAPNDARAFYVRGRVRLERGAEGALADLEEAARLCQRKDALILHWLAAALHKNCNYDQALTTQREAVELRPKDKELLEQLGELEKVKSAESNRR